MTQYTPTGRTDPTTGNPIVKVAQYVDPWTGKTFRNVEAQHLPDQFRFGTFGLSVGIVSHEEQHEYMPPLLSYLQATWAAYYSPVYPHKWASIDFNEPETHVAIYGKIIPHKQALLERVTTRDRSICAAQIVLWEQRLEEANTLVVLKRDYLEKINTLPYLEKGAIRNFSLHQPLPEDLKDAPLRRLLSPMERLSQTDRATHVHELLILVTAWTSRMTALLDREPDELLINPRWKSELWSVGDSRGLHRGREFAGESQK